MAAGTTTDDYKPKLRSTFYFSTHTTFQQTPTPPFPGRAQQGTHIVSLSGKAKTRENPLPFLINVVPLHCSFRKKSLRKKTHHVAIHQKFYSAVGHADRRSVLRILLADRRCHSVFHLRDALSDVLPPVPA